MTYPKEASTVRSPDMIEMMENHNFSNNYEHDMPTTFRSQTLDDDTISSIVSDTTEDDSTKHFNGYNLPPQNLSSNNICIEKSTDILIGSRTNFNGNVVIQNFIAANDGQNPLVTNRDPGTLEDSLTAQNTSDSSWIRSLRTYIPCKSKWVSITLVLICVLSVLGGLVVAAYFLYLHCKLNVMASGNAPIKLNFTDGVYSVAGALFVCKTDDTTVCYVGSSSTSCSNLISSDGRPFVSGHTTSGLCKIYSEKGCQGNNLQEIGKDHVPFYFHALSASC